MKKRLAMMLVLAMLTAIMGGCSGNRANTPEPAEEEPAGEEAQPAAGEETGSAEEADAGGDKQITIGVVTKIIDPFFQKLIDGCVARGDELGIKVIYGAASNSTAIEEQIHIVEDMIAQDVDGLILVPIDSKALVPVAVQAIEQGIAVCNFDNKFDADTVKEAGVDYIPFIGIDNEEAAYLSTKYLCEYMQGEGKVAICEGLRGADNATLRKNGAERAFGEYPGIEIVASQPGDFVTEPAYTAFANVLQAHPEITGIFCAGDLMAVGVIQAVEEAGLSDQISIAGFDADDANLVFIKEGKQLVDLDQNPAGISAKAVDVCLDMINGKDAEENYTVEPILVTEENVDGYLEKAGL